MFKLKNNPFNKRGKASYSSIANTVEGIGRAKLESGRRKAQSIMSGFDAFGQMVSGIEFGKGKDKSVPEMSTEKRKQQADEVSDILKEDTKPNEQAKEISIDTSSSFFKKRRMMHGKRRRR